MYIFIYSCNIIMINNDVRFAHATIEYNALTLVDK